MLASAQAFDAGSERLPAAELALRHAEIGVVRERERHPEGREREARPGEEDLVGALERQRTPRRGRTGRHRQHDGCGVYTGFLSRLRRLTMWHCIVPGACAPGYVLARLRRSTAGRRAGPVAHAPGLVLPRFFRAAR